MSRCPSATVAEVLLSAHVETGCTVSEARGQVRYFAHSGACEGREDWQSLQEHLEETGARAAAFLGAVGCGPIAKSAGLLHDLGKFNPEFLRRLSGESVRVDHSTAGAKVAIERYGGGDARRASLGKMLAYAIAGHHAGLADGVGGERRPRPLEERLGAEVPDPDKVWEQEIELPELAPPPLKPQSRERAGFCGAFATRMVFSALVDADYLDTEAFYAKLGNRPVERGDHPSLEVLRGRLEAHLRELMSKANDTAVNRLRREVLEHARGQAAEVPGLFTFTVPTGGGKTLSSLAFALDHAVRHGLGRVIFVIPYTSIIDQTAQVFREALVGDVAEPTDFVVEHHTGFDEEAPEVREGSAKLRLAMENWDAPIIVTTAVQFFESLFSNRPSRCRKLHNLTNSVVVLDEAQTLPLRLLLPCVAALDELARNWKASVVLCTATQPALRAQDGFGGGLEEVRELAPDPPGLHQSLRRTRIRRLKGRIEDAKLADRLRESPQALCIVNTRRHARELHELVRGDREDESFHLSTLMCPRHRRAVLETVRRRLKHSRPVRLVATSLVEAGVDVDFPEVWRAEAGLESIVQAAGRCNREGSASMGEVVVFEPADGDGRRPPGDVAKLAGAARGVIRRHPDPAAPKAIQQYFREVYWLHGSQLDSEDILAQFRERADSFDFPFATIARQFRMIESSMFPVIVPYRGARPEDGRVERLLRELEHSGRPGGLARRLQPYTVQVPREARRRLLDAGAARCVRPEVFGGQFVVLTNLDLYRPDVGLTWSDPTYREAEGLVF